MPLEIKELFFNIPFSVMFRWKNREEEKKGIADLYRNSLWIV